MAKGKHRKIAYVLGAGFSYGSKHEAPIGKHSIKMPLQFSLFEELCRFHYRRIDRLDLIAKTVRRYFSPNTYRATRGKGSLKHKDLFGLSVEEIVTFFDEVVNKEGEDANNIKEAAQDLQELTVELISYLSTRGNPGQNVLLKKFAKRLAQTDVVVTFNWDTLLDRVLSNQPRLNWHPYWGYGQKVREEFKYVVRRVPKIPRKYPRLLKLHGSINWLATRDTGLYDRIITKDWTHRDRVSDVVMMPPKMIKNEITGRQASEITSLEGRGNNAATSNFYPDLWTEAEKQLARSRRIVFVGYSFPPADFAVANMLRRAISSMKVATGQFPAVDIVDPNAAELAKRFKQSFMIQIPFENQYLSLESYLSSSRAK